MRNYSLKFARILSAPSSCVRANLMAERKYFVIKVNRYSPHYGANIASLKLPMSLKLSSSSRFCVAPGCGNRESHGGEKFYDTSLSMMMMAKFYCDGHAHELQMIFIEPILCASSLSAKLLPAAKAMAFIYFHSPPH